MLPRPRVSSLQVWEAAEVEEVVEAEVEEEAEAGARRLHPAKEADPQELAPAWFAPHPRHRQAERTRDSYYAWSDRRSVPPDSASFCQPYEPPPSHM